MAHNNSFGGFTPPTLCKASTFNAQSCSKADFLAALQDIEKFDPCTNSNISDFCETISTYRSICSWSNEQTLEAIKLKAKGEALMLVKSLLPSSADDILGALSKQYKTKVSTSHLIAELCDIQINSGEKIRDFRKRIESIVLKLKSIDPLATPNEIFLISLFKRSLSANIRSHLASSNWVTLAEVADHAEKLDQIESAETKNKTDSISVNAINQKVKSKPAIVCKYCKKDNHTIDQCKSLARKNQNRPTVAGQLQKSFKCNNCGGIGHGYRQCPSRPYVQTGVQASQNQQAANARKSQPPSQQKQGNEQ